MGYVGFTMLLIFLASVGLISGYSTGMEMEVAATEEEGANLIHFEVNYLENEEADEKFEELGAAAAKTGPGIHKEPIMTQNAPAPFLESVISQILTVFLMCSIPLLALVLCLVAFCRERKSQMRKRAAQKLAEKYEMF